MSNTFSVEPHPHNKDIKQLKRNGKVIRVIDESGRLICGASMRNGGVDRKRPMKGSHRCRLHGGKMLRELYD